MLNFSKHCYVSVTIQLNISHFLQLIDQTILFQATEFGINDLLALILNVKHFFSLTPK